MSDWQSIQTAPRDGSVLVCWREGWEHPCLLCWKCNTRIEENDPIYSQEYFGDLEEYDDYELAEADGGPTHWHPLSPLPNAGVRPKEQR